MFKRIGLIRFFLAGAALLMSVFAAHAAIAPNDRQAPSRLAKNTGDLGVRVAQISIGGGGFGVDLGGYRGKRTRRPHGRGHTRRRGAQRGYDYGRGHSGREHRRRRRFQPRITIDIDTRRRRPRRDRKDRNYGHDRKPERVCRYGKTRKGRCRRRPGGRKPSVVIDLSTRPSRETRPSRANCRYKSYRRRHKRKCRRYVRTPKEPVIIVRPPRTKKVPQRRKPVRTVRPRKPVTVRPRKSRTAPKRVTRRRPSPPRIIRRLPPVPPQLPPRVATATENLWPGEVVVQLATASPASTEAAIARAYNLSVVSSELNQLVNRRIVRYRFGDRRRAQSVANALSADPRVTRAQPNWRYRVMQAAAGGSAKSGASSLQYALAKLGLSDAHAIVRGRGVKVAVIDSGVDEAHPALSSAVSTAFDAAPERGRLVGKHGTAIAGIFKAQGILKGVAPSSELLAIRAFFADAKDGPEQSSTAILMRSLDWAFRKGARVINMSFAGPQDEAIAEAVRSARRQGAVLIAAAGNGGIDAMPAYPAAYPDVIAVTATDERDRLYAKANRGDYIDVAAPGVDIFVVAPGKGYRHDSGTSFAAAHVSGVVALLLERDSSLDSTSVAVMLRDGAADLGKPGPDSAFGAGTIHAVTLLKSATVDVAEQ